MHARKTATIKVEVEKLLKVGFIYPIPLTELVSNIISVMKNQGTIRVCVDCRDLNKFCPKDNYPVPLIDHIIDSYAKSVVFSFIDGFSSYNQINILPLDQHKTAFIFPWGSFAYRKIPFGLKNDGATFQCAMYYDIDDIKSMLDPYLDDLPSHSTHQEDHLRHLRSIFVRFRYYNIHLNPPKFLFCVETRWLLGFIVSKDGILVDPLKVKDILSFPPPTTLHQLQCLQGKENLLCHFLWNCVEITEGFMWLLKKGVPFIWDEQELFVFEDLKHALTTTLLIHSPNYTRDYILYLIASTCTIGMVLVEEDDASTKHVIYYLSKSLLHVETRYSHVEKLALAVVIVV